MLSLPEFPQGSLWGVAVVWWLLDGRHSLLPSGVPSRSSLWAHQFSNECGCNGWWLWHPLSTDMAGNIPFRNYIFFQTTLSATLLPYYMCIWMRCWSTEHWQVAIWSWLLACLWYSQGCVWRKASADVYSVELKTSKGKVNIKDIHSYYGTISYVKRWQF